MRKFQSWEDASGFISICFALSMFMVIVNAIISIIEVVIRENSGLTTRSQITFDVLEVVALLIAIYYI